MARRFATLLLAIESRLSALDGEHEHRTGLGLARVHPTSFAGLTGVPRRVGAAAGTLADGLAAQIVTATETLLPGLSGVLRPKAGTKPNAGSRRD